MALDDVTGITQTFAEMAPSTPATQAIDLGLQQGQDPVTVSVSVKVNPLELLS